MRLHLIQQKSLLGLIASMLAVGIVAAAPRESSMAHGASVQPTLYFLNLRNGVRAARVNDLDKSGADSKLIVKGEGAGPDGIAIDEAAGHVYWTNMGRVSLDDGSIMRANLDGSNVVTVVPAGGTFTPKQLKLDTQHRKLYWSDREGMRVMRSNLDGTKIETLVITGSGDVERKDAARWCVGIAIDTNAGKIYWSQKGGDNAQQGTIKRANIELPAGEDAAHRSDIEVLFSGLPEPIDLDIDAQHKMLYWTDRGDNTISRAPLNPKNKSNPAARSDRQIVVRNLQEAIGITLDVKRNRMYYTDLGGNVGGAALDGKNARMLLTAQGALTGIAMIDLH